MRLRNHFGLFYGILVLLIVAIGVWWVVFLTYEGRHYERARLDVMAADSTNAALLIRTSPEIHAEPERHLGAAFPHLAFEHTDEGIRVTIRKESVEEVRSEAGRRQRMFTAEGVFLLLLLAAASTILTLSYRSEREFKRARELFLAGATHELKTPLASLRLYTETLGRNGVDGQEADRIRNRMLEDLTRLEDLLEQILSLGYDEKPPLGAATPVDLAEETEMVLQDMRGYLSTHEATVKADLPRGHGVSAPRSILALVIRNLMTNAVRHTPSPAMVTVSLRRAGQWVRLAVTDRGPGIPRKYHKKIFDGLTWAGDWEGLSRKPKGGGLGLYLALRQAKMMGGRIEVESEPGQGSTFTLVLPGVDEGS